MTYVYGPPSLSLRDESDIEPSFGGLSLFPLSARLFWPTGNHAICRIP